MKRLHQKILTGTLMAAMGLTAIAQNNPAPTAGTAPREAGMPRARMERGDAEHTRQHMAERHAQHLKNLKAKLQLSADQESAWTTFSTAMQPPASSPKRMTRSELENLSTPERIDQMNRQMTQHQDAMRQRGEATKAFYAALTAEQKKIFDKEMLAREQRGPARRP